MKAEAEIINKMLSEVGIYPYGHRKNMKRIETEDGQSLSVQASSTHYCTPRENEGPWHNVEVGFPSIEPPESWAGYMDGDWEADDRTNTVYGYIPIEMVVDFINKHGGIKS